MNKSQVAIEFVVTIGLSIFMLFLFTAIIYDQTIRFNKERELVLVDDLSSTLQKEFILAETVNDGYTRTFKVPETLLGLPYSVYAQGKELVVKSVHYESVAALPDVSNINCISKGLNTVIKNQSGIYLKNETCPI